MVSASENSSYTEEIEQDVPRTFPEHPWLSHADGHAALTRVLKAYSVHNDKIGYCRALNNIAGMLLVTLNRNEEIAFWLLAALVEDIIYPGTYARNLEGCQVEMKALDELIASKLPKLHAHFRAIDFDISMLATDWYLCLFSSSLPSETVSRVWDALFNEGPKILFRVALALLKIYEDNILRVDNAGELMMRMRSAAATMHHRDVLMFNAFEEIGSLSMATIEKFREQKQKEVEAILQSRGVQKTALPTAGVDGDKKSKGFSALMKSGMSKLADKTAEQFSKLHTKDAEGGGGSGGGAVGSGGGAVGSGGGGGYNNSSSSSHNNYNISNSNCNSNINNVSYQSGGGGVGYQPQTPAAASSNATYSPTAVAGSPHYAVEGSNPNELLQLDQTSVPAAFIPLSVPDALTTPPAAAVSKSNDSDNNPFA
eukprot:CAMPEP_0175086916 /NCGR_PEP_ID=MMETSP0052_2-20121109/29530_1 /TAXON_ID=51329 ORGANISM="Polytomella parva, Strain SAG 63-3" /NCGR_SAMPLE_ID=MMETSP0052_2 /ASSEMBLY_ACC=CAM_ASM_000194 /LENGTH=425 /DNA_ID=CAMNT_0016359183 /DNA_START=290 /DNA_END=1567 /DNA_ORIENTATION=+